MKAKMFWIWSLAAALAVLPFAGGGDQQAEDSVPAIAPEGGEATVESSVAWTNTVPPGADTPDLEDAAGRILSDAVPPPPDVKLSGPAADVVRLAQAGVEEGVMLSFVTNSPNTFNLSSDAIIYLNDLGVPAAVVTAMIEHDQNLRAAVPYVALPWEVTANTNQPAPGTAIPYPLEASESESTDEPAPLEMMDTVEPSPTVDVSYNYFYDSLAPYGSWIDIAGYGPCWQPTVVVVNPGWQPYCNNGHWVYSDCGWYWVSDYTWGWAPFHYGRWFRHQRWGWCWVPGRVWGPSWVTWRYTHGYCGWAPLPPRAVYTPGIGFAYRGKPAGVSFSFGLSQNCFTFVPANRFCDPHPHRYRLSRGQVSGFYRHTVAFNQFGEDSHHRIMNKGIPVNRIAAARGAGIHTFRIHDAANPVAARAGRLNPNGRTLSAYRPHVPPLARAGSAPGAGVRPASPVHGVAAPGGVWATRAHPLPPGSVRPLPWQGPARAGNPVPPSVPAGSELRHGSGGPPALRGPSAPMPVRSGNETVRTPAAPEPVLSRPAPPTRAPSPIADSSRPNRLPDRQQFTVPSRQTPAPAPGPVQRQSPVFSRPVTPGAGRQNGRFQGQPGVPGPNRSEVRTTQPVRTLQRQGSSPRFNNPAPQRPQQNFRSEPTRSQASRVQTRQAPPARSPQSPPPSQRSAPASQGGGQGGQSRHGR